MRDVHDDVAQPEEGLGVERLREEVSQVVVRGDEGHAQLVLLDALAHVEVSTGDVLGLGMVFPSGALTGPTLHLIPAALERVVPDKCE